MEYLGQVRDWDPQIYKELATLGIRAVRNKKVQVDRRASVVGKFGRFTFVRNHDYWIVSGSVPVVVAREMYADPLGYKDVRVNGSRSRPYPDHFAENVDGEWVVTYYHIDTQEGLNLFVQTMRRHGLA